jgi:hypothetical protein
MGDSLRYTTVESSRAILEELYASSEETPFFPCEIHIPIRRKDRVDDGTATIYINRMRHTAHAYELANDERIYRTEARTSPDGELFDIDVMIHSRQSTLVGATVVASPRIYKIVENMILDSHDED